MLLYWVSMHMYYSSRSTYTFIGTRQIPYMGFWQHEKKLARFFNSTFRYIDDVLAQTYSYFEDFIYCEGQLRTKLYQAKYEFYKVHNYDFKSFSMVSSVTSAVILFLSVALYELGTGNALLGSWPNNTDVYLTPFKIAYALIINTLIVTDIKSN
jgi:hypothetical protein